MSDCLRFLQPLICQSLLEILPRPVMLNLTGPHMRETERRWGGGGLCIPHYDTLIKLSLVSQGQLDCWNEFSTSETSVFLVRVITHGALSAISYPPCCSEKYSIQSPVTLIQLCSNIRWPSSPPSNADNNQATHIKVSCGSSVNGTSHWNTSYHLNRGLRIAKHHEDK